MADESSAVILLKSIFIILFITVAIIGNISVLYVISKYRNLRSIPNYFIANLAVSDLLYAIFGSTALAITGITKTWLLGHTYCYFIGVTNVTLWFSSVWTLVLISFNRFVAVYKPLRVRSIFTVKRIFFVVVSIWFVAIVISIFPLLGWSEVVAGKSYCTINAQKDKSYIITVMIINYVIPAIMLPITYYKINMILRARKIKLFQKRNKIEKLPNISLDRENIQITPTTTDTRNTIVDTRNTTTDTRNTTVDTRNTIADTRSIQTIYETKRQNIRVAQTISCEFLSMPQNDYCSNHVISKEARLTAVMLAIVVAFFICWTPLIVASVLYTSNITTKEFSFVSFSIILRSVNGVVNPIIYGILNKNFRKAYKTICFTMVRFLLYRCHSSI